jgi:putative ABC transport system substrate-binding protein
MIRRREFITILGSAAAWPIAARAQLQAMATIGWLDPGQPTRGLNPYFKQGLAEMGYVEGRNLAIEYRYAEGHNDRLPALAADLVRRRVMAIVASGAAPTAMVAKAATQTIPIVFLGGGDPIELGLVASFNRPGGNVTGVHVLAADLMPKRLELLHKLVPSVELIAVLVGAAGTDFTKTETRDISAAARLLGVRLSVLNAVTENDIATTFATLVEQRAGALLIGNQPFFVTTQDQILSLAARHAMPTMFLRSPAVAAGGLASYGPDLAWSMHQVGLYTARILRGEKPPDLPVMQPTKFEFVINLKTAKTLGLTVPPGLMAIANEVIE